MKDFEPTDIERSRAQTERMFSICFACATLLLNAVSAILHSALTGAEGAEWISALNISAALDMFIVCGFFFGFSPFAFYRFKVSAAAGFFAYMQYSSVGYFDDICAMQLISGAAMAGLSVRLPILITSIIGVVAVCSAGWINSVLYLD